MQSIYYTKAIQSEGAIMLKNFIILFFAKEFIIRIIFWLLFLWFAFPLMVGTIRATGAVINDAYQSGLNSNIATVRIITQKVGNVYDRVVYSGFDVVNNDKYVSIYKEEYEKSGINLTTIAQSIYDFFNFTTEFVPDSQSKNYAKETIDSVVEKAGLSTQHTENKGENKGENK
jgi:hypothetical protein